MRPGNSRSSFQKRFAPASIPSIEHEPGFVSRRLRSNGVTLTYVPSFRYQARERGSKPERM
jgi:hypothetical protein